MKRITFILIVIACCFGPSFAMWALVPLDELVQDSDLIVVGTLEDVSDYSQNGMDYGQGTIRIDEVVWGAAGAASAGESVTLKWQNPSGLICPRVEHRHSQGQKAIWLLTLDNGGVVRANYPGRFVELSKRTEVEKILRKKPVCLRAAKFAFGPDEPVSVSLVFRNPTQSSIAFPGVELVDGLLMISPDVSITMCSGYGETRKVTRPLQDKVLSSGSVAPIQVGPGQEFRLNVDLRNFFTLSDEESYSLQLRVKGFGSTNAISVYPNEPTSPGINDVSTYKIGARERTARLSLLIPSLVAIVVSSIFVYRHSRDFADAGQKPSI